MTFCASVKEEGRIVGGEFKGVLIAGTKRVLGSLVKQLRILIFYKKKVFSNSLIKEVLKNKSCQISSSTHKFAKWSELFISLVKDMIETRKPKNNK